MVDRPALLAAQVHPERQRDLIVRVAGYSAFFNALSKATQDDLIARPEQSLQSDRQFLHSESGCSATGPEAAGACWVG